jgi:hypothetical protein
VTLKFDQIIPENEDLEFVSDLVLQISNFPGGSYQPV